MFGTTNIFAPYLTQLVSHYTDILSAKAPSGHLKINVWVWMNMYNTHCMVVSVAVFLFFLDVSWNKISLKFL